MFRLEQTYNQIEIKSQLEDEIFSHATSSTPGAASCSSYSISTTHVEIKLRNQSHNIIEIGDSSDEEETTHTSDELVQQATLQMVPPVNILGARVVSTCCRLEQCKDSK